MKAYDKFYTTRYLMQYFGDIAGNDFDLEGICRILGKDETVLEGYDILVKDIIDSPHDVDRLDYLVRDAHMTGLSLGEVNVQALIERMIPFEETTDGKRTITLVFEPSAIPYITHLLYARDSMYMNCYEHPRKIVAEKMLIGAIEEFRAKYRFIDLDDIIFLSDDQLLRLLVEFSEPNEISYQYSLALLRNTLFEEVYCIHPGKRAAWEEKRNGTKQPGGRRQQDEQVPAKPSEGVKNWVKSSGSFRTRYMLNPKEWEATIADEAGLGHEQQWKVLITVPLLGSIEPRLDMIRILTESDGKYGYRTLDALTGYWEGILRHTGVERYCIRVFVSPDLAEDVKVRVRQAAENLLTEQ